MSNLIIVLYIIYMLFIAIVTFIVAKILFTNGKTFMNVIFQNRDHLATATNRLFEMGFFLLALGIGLYWMESVTIIQTYKTLLEEVSYKVGSYTLFLGVLVMLFTYMFFRGMKYRSRNDIHESNKMILSK